jgi:hypothetical protein
MLLGGFHLSLDELHARRLETVMGMVANALDRIEHLLAGQEAGSPVRRVRQPTDISSEQIRKVREESEIIRRRLGEAARRFSIRPRKPDPRQTLAAELASLWVILENARPRRLKGYGREFAAADKADWEALIQDLLRELERLRSALAHS